MMLALSDLARLLAAVRPHLGTDTAYPALTKIRLEATESALLAIATDRYTFAVARHPLTTPPTAMAAHMPATEADELIDRALLEPTAPVALEECWPDAQTIDPEPMLSFGDDWCLLEDPDGFPDWRSLLHTALESAPAPIDGLHISPQQLARLTAVRTAHPFADVRLSPRRRSPLLIRVDDWFLVALNPAHRDGATDGPATRVEELARELAARP